MVSCSHFSFRRLLFPISYTREEAVISTHPTHSSNLSSFCSCLLCILNHKTLADSKLSSFPFILPHSSQSHLSKIFFHHITLQLNNFQCSPSFTGVISKEGVSTPHRVSKTISSNTSSKYQNSYLYLFSIHALGVLCVRMYFLWSILAHPLIHSADFQLSVQYVPGSGEKGVNKMDENPCPGEVYMIVGEDRQQTR